MGAGQQREHVQAINDLSETDINQSRFLTCSLAQKLRINRTDLFQIPAFKRLIGWQLQLEEISSQDHPNNHILLSSSYFREKKDQDIYLGALLGLRQIGQMNIYEDIEIKQQKGLFCIVLRSTLPGIAHSLDKKQMNSNISKFIDLLIFLAQMLVKTQNLYIEPFDIVEYNGQFHIRGIMHRQYQKKTLLLAYITWLYEQFQNFEEGITTQNILTSFNQLDIYVKQIYHTIKNNKINDIDLVIYLKKIKQKIRYLAGNFDSFHACFKAKRVKYSNPVIKEWILVKKMNQIYFFNLEDEHVCQGRVIRKKTKINVQGIHLVFNAQDYEVNFMLQGTKNLVKTSDFELQDSFTISDIEIKFKFPFKIRNPMMFLRGRQLYMLDQMVFRYSIDQNKLYQQSKKINDCLCLVPSIQNNYLIVRLSIDIFRHGIRIYIGDRYDTLFPSGNPEMVSEIQNLKIDIKHIQFCIQIYKGIYIMLANKNLWILDINFMCFFSYAPIERLKDHGKGKVHQQSDFVFQIINQPFSANWLTHQQGLNVAIKEDVLHVIGNVMGKLFYLQYRFIFEAGILKLIKYKPLFHQQTTIQTMKQIAKPLKQSYFNVYNENLQFYKTSHWLWRGSVFLQVKNIKIVTNKTFSQISVETDETLSNLKDLIDYNRVKQRLWTKIEITILLYRVFVIYEWLCKNNVSHKNFNLNNLWISSSRQLKLSGWSEPPRNWHVSDYKDFLLVCFNIVTQCTYEKLTDKLLQKHEEQMQGFAFLHQKLVMGLKLKVAQKKIQLQKQTGHIKECLHKQIYKLIVGHKRQTCLFSFEYNTPRFSVLNLSQTKIKKMIATIDSTNNHEQFTFKSSDCYVWNEQQSSLYILTANYQMLQAKINYSDFKEESIVLEEYQYLPQNIIDCSFINSPKGLFAFGGIARHSKKKVIFNRNVYYFNRQKLTWISVAQLDEPRINPKLILSESGQFILVMGGELGLGNQHLQALRFNLNTYATQKLLDMGIINPLKKIGDKHSLKIFQISQSLNIFLIWSVTSTNYYFKIFSSMVCGFQIDVQGKIYLDQNGELPQIGITFMDGCIHFLRPYGKYSKITLGNFQNPSLSNKTLYSN